MRARSARPRRERARRGAGVRIVLEHGDESEAVAPAVSVEGGDSPKGDAVGRGGEQ